MKSTSPSVARLFTTRVVPTLLLLALGSGCQSFYKNDSLPELARRPYQPHQQAWVNSMKGWMPNWEEPILPMPARRAPGQAPAQNIPAPVQVHKRAAVKPPPPRPDPAPVQAPAPAAATTSSPLPAVIVDDHRISRGQVPADSEAFIIVADNEGTTTSAGARLYTVRKGETLTTIARKFYGDEKAWKRIYKANRDVMRNPHQIKPGITLRIP